MQCKESRELGQVDRHDCDFLNCFPLPKGGRGLLSIHCTYTCCRPSSCHLPLPPGHVQSPRFGTCCLCLTSNAAARPRSLQLSVLTLPSIASALLPVLRVPTAPQVHPTSANLQGQLALSTYAVSEGAWHAQEQSPPDSLLGRHPTHTPARQLLIHDASSGPPTAYMATSASPKCPRRYSAVNRSAPPDRRPPKPPPPRCALFRVLGLG